MCDVANLQPPGDIEGKSLRPIWTGEVETIRDSLFTTYEDKMRAVRDDRYKLIRYPLINHTQLFDLQNDPHELHNLAADPAHAERVDNLLTLLTGWQKRTDDKQPLTTDNPQPMEIDLTGRERKPDRWQPAWIVEKYFD